MKIEKSQKLELEKIISTNECEEKQKVFLTAQIDTKNASLENQIEYRIRNQLAVTLGILIGLVIGTSHIYSNGMGFITGVLLLISLFVLIILFYQQSELYKSYKNFKSKLLNYRIACNGIIEKCGSIEGEVFKDISRMLVTSAIPRHFPSVACG